MRPNISPRSTDSERFSTATVAPYRLATPSSVTAWSAAKENLRLDGHPGLQHAVRVLHRYLHAIHELRAFVGRLHVARRELGFGGDVADRTGDARAAGVGEDRRRLPEAQPRDDRLVDVDVRPRVVEIGDDHD